MKQLLESFFAKLPVAAQTYFYGAYHDLLHAAEHHPELVATMIAALDLPPDLEALRTGLGAAREALIAAVESAAKA